MNTDKELVKELEERNAGGRYDGLIANAKAKMYHDFATTLATPKMVLCQDLSQFPELKDVVQDVISGKYDEDWPDKKKI